MAFGSGNEIIVSSEPKGRFMDGIVGAGLTIYPGMVCQIQIATALVGGRWTWELFNGDANGGRPKGPFIVVTPDHLQGKTALDAYTAGMRIFGYVPLPGEELNLLLADVSGTGDDHTKGEVLIVSDASDATRGKWIATASTPETEPAMLLETITDPTGDTLAWAIWTGY